MKQSPETFDFRVGVGSWHHSQVISCRSTSRSTLNQRRPRRLIVRKATILKHKSTTQTRVNLKSELKRIHIIVPNVVLRMMHPVLHVKNAGRNGDGGICLKTIMLASGNVRLVPRILQMPNQSAAPVKLLDQVRTNPNLVLQTLLHLRQVP